MLTKQEIFNKAYLGVIAQGRPGRMTYGGGCAYYDKESGTKCGIGHILSDREIKHLAANGRITSSISNLTTDMLPDHPELVGRHKDFAKHIQAAHDGCPSGRMFLDEFRARMSGIAEVYGLEVPVTEKEG